VIECDALGRDTINKHFLLPRRSILGEANAFFSKPKLKLATPTNGLPFRLANWGGWAIRRDVCGLEKGLKRVLKKWQEKLGPDCKSTQYLFLQISIQVLDFFERLSFENG